MCDNVALALIFFFFLIIFPLPLKLPDLNGNSNPALSCRPGGRAEAEGRRAGMETRGKAQGKLGRAALSGGWRWGQGQEHSFFPKTAAMGSAITSNSCQQL